MKKVAIVGIQGVPANYGGFESLVENIIGENCSPDIHYTVFCSAKDITDRCKEYKGCKLRYVPFHANGVQSIPYDICSMIKSVKGYDTILVLGTSGCIFLPILKMLTKSKIIVNIDGLEHRREKWGKLARRFLRASESVAVHNADVVIADNQGIKDYVTQTYHKESVMIAYGGDHVLRDVSQQRKDEVLMQYGLKQNDYAITVCRIEPENNAHVILKAFSLIKMPLVFIGNWNHSEYGRQLREKYKSFDNIRMVNAVYDLDTLYCLRSQCKCYIHGHSAGGTNPSLVEAMFFGRPVIAYDVVYNRETTDNKARYFSDIESLRQLLLHVDNFDGRVLEEYAKEHYTWKHIAHQYEELY